MTSFIGRQQERTELGQILTENRLVTLLGPGGVGKTRLALQLAEGLLDRFPDGIWFTDLSAVTEADLVYPKIAEALGIAEGSPLPAKEKILSFLQKRKLLLILDNCEHLIHQTALASQALLAGCPDLTLLSTSREPLKILGEVTYQVPPLALPDTSIRDLEELNKYESAQLFIDRARQYDPQFHLTHQDVSPLAEICTCLDGLPLALELAAEKTRCFSLSEIRNRLSHPFRLLKSKEINLTPRQKTLSALIDWSYNLLSREEKTVLAILSILPGKWDFQTAEIMGTPSMPIPLTEEPLFFRLLREQKAPLTVLGSAWDHPGPDIQEILPALVEKSLITVESDEIGTARHYTILSSIREYARQKLIESGEETETLERLRDLYIFQAERVEWRALVEGDDYALQELLPYQENIDRLLKWSLETGNRPLQSARLVCALFGFWKRTGKFQKGFSWSEQFLSLVDGKDQPWLRWKLLFSASILSTRIQQFPQGIAYAREALVLADQLDSGPARALSFRAQGFLYFFTDTAAAKQALETSLKLCREYGLDTWATINRMNLGLVHQREGSWEQSKRYLQDCLTLSRRNNFQSSLAFALANYADLDLQEERYTPAIEALQEAVQIAQTLGDRLHESIFALILGNASRCSGRLEEAEAIFLHSVRLNEALAFNPGIQRAKGCLAYLAARKGEKEKAASFLKEVQELPVDRPGDSYDIILLTYLAGTLFLQGDYREALMIDAALEERQKGMPDCFLPLDLREREERRETIRKALGEEPFREAEEQGRQASLKALIGSLPVTQTG